MVSEGHLVVFRGTPGGLQRATRWSSEGHQVVSCGPPGGLQRDTRWSPADHQVVFRGTPGGPQCVHTAQILRIECLQNPEADPDPP